MNLLNELLERSLAKPTPMSREAEVVRHVYQDARVPAPALLKPVPTPMSNWMCIGKDIDSAMSFHSLRNGRPQAILNRTLDPIPYDSADDDAGTFPGQ